MASLLHLVGLARRGQICSTKTGRIHSILFGKSFLKTLKTTQVSHGGAATQILMPALSPTMEEGTIVTWLKNEGDAVNPGDALCEIETDKATITMDTEEEGVIAKILVPSGSSKVKVNQLIALMVEEGQDINNVEIPVAEDSVAASSKPKEEIQKTTTSSSGVVGSLLSLSPAVRYLVDTNSLDAKLIPATGRGGRILKGDILRYLSGPEVKRLSKIPVKMTIEPAAQPPQSSIAVSPQTKPLATTDNEEDYIDIPNTGMRSVIAKRLTESKTTIPHVYASADCNMDNLQKIRQQLKEKNIKVSVNDLLVKLAGITLKQVPEMNAVWDGTQSNQLNEVDIAVAVATDGGLITPVIRDAASLDVSQISASLKDLALRARSNKLQLHEFQGGSFTISNLGMFGITEFSAVINPPQASILAVGGTRLALIDGDVLSRVMTVTLSCDARIVDNELASRWLQAFKNNIENPMNAGL